DFPTYRSTLRWTVRSQHAGGFRPGEALLDVYETGRERRASPANTRQRECKRGGIWRLGRSYRLLWVGEQDRSLKLASVRSWLPRFEPEGRREAGSRRPSRGLTGSLACGSLEFGRGSMWCCRGWGRAESLPRCRDGTACRCYSNTRDLRLPGFRGALLECVECSAAERRSIIVREVWKDADRKSVV